MSAWDPLRAGMDTTRTAATDADRRAQRDRDARGNLAAILFEQFGVDPARANHRAPYVRSVASLAVELLQILGVPDQPDREPLPRREPLPPRRGRPPKVTDPGDGYCPWCKRAYRVGPGGRLPTHPAWGLRAGVVTRLRRDCRGSRQVVPRNAQRPRCADPATSVRSPDPVGEVAYGQ